MNFPSLDSGKSLLIFLKYSNAVFFSPNLRDKRPALYKYFGVVKMFSSKLEALS